MPIKPIAKISAVLLCFAQLGVAQPSPGGSVTTEPNRAEQGAVAVPATSGTPTVLEKVEVTGRQEALYNSLDRKVYLVGKDIVSAAGSAGDLLQNVPSVEVDVEGVVSLRGDSGVSILINGKSSAAMDRDPAAALEALSADAIERVEVITNPSAKYKPDGTAGIINLVLKRAPSSGHAGTVRGNVGNDSRYNGSVSGNFQPGKVNFHGRLSLRQDDRPRHAIEERTYPDGVGSGLTTLQQTEENSRPRSVFGSAGFDFKSGPKTEVGATIGFGLRDDTRHSRQLNLGRRADGVVTIDNERVRTAPETEREWDIELTLTHAFDGKDRELTIEVQGEVETERDDSEYRTVYRQPVENSRHERVLDEGKQYDVELTVDYAHRLAARAKLEMGYAGEAETSNETSAGSTLDAGTGRWSADARRSDRFRHESTVHAFYATYGRPFGKFGLLAGLRFEHARDVTDQPDVSVRGRSKYDKFYPSLHLTRDFGDVHRVQLNYSHRVERPDGRDLNPYIDYEDPSHLRAGNPALRPEDVHSIEAGYEYRAGDSTYLASIYHRYRYNGFTDVTRFLDATTLITMPENLGTSRSSGLELGATTRWRKQVALNFSANVYRHEIDAGNLGFNGRRETTAWDAKLNAHWDVSDRLMVQLNTSYRAKRLTPQGERHPSAITNLGVRYNLKDGRTSLVATVSDVFDSLRDRTVIDTPLLESDITRRRSPRIVYVGFVRHFGKPAKKSGEAMEFDDSL